MTTVELPSPLETVVTREFAFPPQLVFEMWTNPVHVPRWYGMPAYLMSDCRIDLRVGGRWRWAQRNFDGEEVAFSGTYREIDAPRRLVFTEEYEAMPGSEYLVTMTFAPDGEGTLLTTHMKYQTQEHRDGHLRSGMTEGTKAIYEQMEAVMAGMDHRVEVPQAVRDYIAAVPPDQQALFRRLHELALATIADVTVALSYNLPTYIGTRERVSLSSGAKGVSIATRIPAPIAAFHEKHPQYKAGKISVLFPADAELPTADVAELIRQAT